ncbi:MAG: Rpn family recombination-promoting nuclease/putative transposase [Phascolarctobacterium sp.]|uniref:Rpn family recombination-promoting nuclease/putative transposase n=1 Tax=Phascolarctobacterium sp. TaxID=2049039 RepID=UPI0026DD891F|nr:Rpn family recombination-promoting nuclease/putative transposase [Phascolarctobacterium sp.]MDO4921675.1 Rpn family recombination-promoting nuclease/putative transposase [Phascolarctobacterium sp.]
MPNEFVKPEYLEKLARLRLIDDTFMRKVFENNTPATELLLRIILQNDKIKVVKDLSQYTLTNLSGHSVQLDVLAQDACGRYLNVEVQSKSEGASPQRARYYVGAIDTAHFPKSVDYRTLFDTYVIFITETDVLGAGQPIYHIERKIEENGASFKDGSHIIYVNGNCRYDQTALSRLMHDFFCTNASDMHYHELKQRVKYLKETEEGVQTMCKIINDLSDVAFAQGKSAGISEGLAQGEAKATLDIAKNMKHSGKFSDDAIVLATNLTLEQVKAIRV